MSVMILHAGNNGSISDPYRLYNLDVFEHAADSPFGLYGSIPLLLAHKQGLSVGAFWYVQSLTVTECIKWHHQQSWLSY